MAGEKLIATAKAEENQENIATALNEHALTLKAMGDYPAAEALYHQALKIARGTIGEGHPELFQAPEQPWWCRCRAAMKSRNMLPSGAGD